MVSGGLLCGVWRGGGAEGEGDCSGEGLGVRSPPLLALPSHRKNSVETFTFALKRKRVSRRRTGVGGAASEWLCFNLTPYLTGQGADGKAGAQPSSARCSPWLFPNKDCHHGPIRKSRIPTTASSSPPIQRA